MSNKQKQQQRRRKKLRLRSERPELRTARLVRLARSIRYEILQREVNLEMRSQLFAQGNSIKLIRAKMRILEGGKPTRAGFKACR